jgi:hypothetical protein
MWRQDIHRFIKMRMKCLRLLVNSESGKACLNFALIVVSSQASN